MGRRSTRRTDPPRTLLETRNAEGVTVYAMSGPAARGELVLVRCTKCGLEADQRFTIAESWTWWSDGLGDLLPFCPRCAEREFEHRITLSRPHSGDSQQKAA